MKRGLRNVQDSQAGQALRRQGIHQSRVAATVLPLTDKGKKLEFKRP